MGAKFNEIVQLLEGGAVLVKKNGEYAVRCYGTIVGISKSTAWSMISGDCVKLVNDTCADEVRYVLNPNKDEWGPPEYIIRGIGSIPIFSNSNSNSKPRRIR